MKLFKQAQKYGSKIAGKAAMLGTGLAVSVESFAQASPLATAADAGITAAKTDGMTVGGYVVAAVASLVVIGVVIALVKKL